MFARLAFCRPPLVALAVTAASVTSCVWTTDYDPEWPDLEPVPESALVEVAGTYAEEPVAADCRLTVLLDGEDDYESTAVRISRPSDDELEITPLPRAETPPQWALHRAEGDFADTPDGIEIDFGLGQGGEHVACGIIAKWRTIRLRRAVDGALHVRSKEFVTGLGGCGIVMPLMIWVRRWYRYEPVPALGKSFRDPYSTGSRIRPD